MFILNSIRIDRWTEIYRISDIVGRDRAELVITQVKQDLYIYFRFIICPWFSLIKKKILLSILGPEKSSLI